MPSNVSENSNTSSGLLFETGFPSVTVKTMLFVRLGIFTHTTALLLTLGSSIHWGSGVCEQHVPPAYTRMVLKLPPSVPNAASVNFCWKSVSADPLLDTVSVTDARAAHTVAELAPDTPEYVPTGHETHALALLAPETPEYVPAAQFAHTVVPNWPAGHEAVCSRDRPDKFCEQFSAESDPTSEDDPTGHGTHAPPFGP